MKKVLISKTIPQAAMDILTGKVDPVILPDFSGETAKRLAADVEGIISRNNIKVTRKLWMPPHPQPILERILENVGKQEKFQ